MKKNYKLSAKTLSAFFLFGFSVAKAQLTIMSAGDFFAGKVTNSGVVSLYTNGGNVYKWDAANAAAGMVQIGALTNGYPGAGTAAISNDGTKVAATMTNSSTGFNEISIYDVATSVWTNLGGLLPTGWDGSVSTAWNMSSDGKVIVGLAKISAGVSQAVKWDVANGIVDLGSMVAGRSSRANAVNGDGTVIVGWQDTASGRKGAKWVNGVESLITDGNGNPLGEAQDVSADGNTIIGFGTFEPYIWNNITGVTTITHPGAGSFFRGGATAISGDGSKVIGYFRPFPAAAATGEGFIWTPTGGRVNLNDYVTGLGISTQGIKLSLPVAISQDGKKIAGIGLTASNSAVAFYLDLTSYLSANENNIAQSNISIYPNPVKNSINLKGAGKIEKAQIYNMVGQKIMSFESIEDMIDVSSLPKGNYVIEIFVKREGSRTFKFIKE